MRHLARLPLVGAAVAAACAAPAFAQDAAAPAAAPPPFTVSGGATVVTDYRFRGISQTNKRFAIQGTLTVSHASGLYAGTWGSSIDDYVAYGSDQEIDLFAGYKKTVGKATIDGGLLYYYYPGSSAGFSGHNNSDFFEPYLSVTATVGPVSVKGGGNYSWKQHALSCTYNPNCHRDSEDNLYVYGELSGAIPHTPITLTGHFGHDFGRSNLTFGLKSYNDWSLNAAYTWNHITFGVTYVDTDFKRRDPTTIVFPDLSTRQEASAGVVGSIGVSF